MRIFKHYIPWNLAFLVVAESTIVFGSVYAGHIIKHIFDFKSVFVEIDYNYLKALVIACAVIVTFYIVDLYDISLPLRRGELFVKVSTCLVIAFFIIASINFLAPSLHFYSMDYMLFL